VRRPRKERRESESRERIKEIPLTGSKRSEAY